MTKRALILGVTGQDGSYLADILLEKGYEVHGLVRRSSAGNTWRIDHIRDKLILHQGDLTDPVSLQDAIYSSRPDEIYNEADQDHVGWSKRCPIYSYEVTFKSVGVLLELILNNCPNTKLFQPVSATMLDSSMWPQTECTPLKPQSPYAVAKAATYHLCRFYREQYGLFVTTGIMFNHDSERRLEHYLINKVCRSVIRISRGEQDKLVLGDLDYKVDIGYAREFMEIAAQLMQLDESGDFIVATGQSLSVRELATSALGCLGLTSDKLEEDPNYQKQNGSLIGSINKLKESIGLEPDYYGDSLVNKIITEIIVYGREHANW